MSESRENLTRTDVVLQGIVATSAGQHKHLMLLVSGSTSNFDSTWSLYSYNDPYNNKSDWDIVNLINGGDYKTYIDPSWGGPEWIYVDFLNAHADVIAEIQFYVPNINITSQTSWMSTTFDLVRPLNLATTEANFTVRDGDMELLVRELGTLNTWAALVYSQSGLKPVVAMNASNPLLTESIPQHLGCKPISSLDVSYQFNSTNNMTVQYCFVSACSSTAYEYVGIKLGIDCYCVNITVSDLYEDYPGNCTKTCAGDSSQKCGGRSHDYLSVYDATNQTDTLLTSEVQNATLLTVFHNGFTSEFTVNVASNQHWPDDYMYITGIRVNGENNIGNNVTYSFEYRYDNNYNDSFVMYETALNDPEWFGVTGTSYELDVLLISEIKVKFPEGTRNIVVELIGPKGNETSPAHVTAEYLHVIGLFNPTTTTTPTTTITTPNVTKTTNSTVTTTPTTATLNVTTTTNSTVTITPTTTTTPNVTTSTNSTVTTTPTTFTTPNVTTTTNSSVTTTPTATTPNVTTTTTTNLTVTTTPTTTNTTSHLIPVSTTSTSTPSPSTTSVPSPTTASGSTNTTSPSATTTSTATTSTTSSPSTVVYSNYSILINGQLYCPCVVSSPVNNSQNETVDIEKIIAELTLDKSTLSSNTRRYNSAEDSRPSARTIGAVGVIIITAVVGLILAMDGANLKSEMGKIKKNYRYLKKQISKRSLKIDDIATVSQKKPDNLPDVLT